jgi:hypothetical protein
VTDAKLENRRNDASAKCANCLHWSMRNDPTAVIGVCTRTLDYMSLDLAVCTGWEANEVLTGRILKPDEIIDAD